MGHIALADVEITGGLPTQGKTNFYYSFSFLPKDERTAINTVYAFCRQIDDIVDEVPAEVKTPPAEVILRKRERLAKWRAKSNAATKGLQLFCCR